ncbi:MAG: cupin domain-containing protein [Desulfobacterales bacterium]|nr:cupin domain-containing protein [Desulfobacterales bacterium]
MSNTPQTFEEWWVGSHYRKFVESEGVPLYEESYLDNLATLPLAEWERRGGKAAYTRLGDQEVNNLQIVEIPPKGQLKPEKHMYEAVMYVMSGTGATMIWQEGEPRQTVEWSEGTLLAIPLNAWHQEFNSSGDQPCRFLFGTNMAQVINLYQNLDFIFNNPFVFKDRYRHEMEKDYAEKNKHWSLRLSQTNFIPDVRKLKLDTWAERGTRTSIMRLHMGNTKSQIHVLEVSEGTYVTAHRHGPGAHVIQIEGEGYELLFNPGDEINAEGRRKVPIKPYGVISPRRNEYHQHFNTGKGPFRQIGFKGWGQSMSSTKKYDPVGAARSDDRFSSAFKLRYDKEDPAVKEEYYRELEKNGVTLRLEPIDQGG